MLTSLNVTIRELTVTGISKQTAPRNNICDTSGSHDKLNVLQICSQSANREVSFTCIFE